MSDFAALSGYVGSGAFGVLVVLLLVAPGGGTIKRLLVAAAAVSAVWFALQAAYYHSIETRVSLHWMALLELCRDLAWLMFLGKVLDGVGDADYRRRVRVGLTALVALLACATLISSAPHTVARLLDASLPDVRKMFLLLTLLVALAGLVMTEQLFRNTAREARWSLKHLCFGIGLLFAYDFYLYADALLFNRTDAIVWSARGIVNAMAVPMIALSAARNREWHMNIFVSRRVVFHGVTVTAAGVYLMAMAVAGYYVQLFGGEWGRALKAAFFSAAILVLLTLFYSVQVRSRIRRFLAKHFYRNKYEYGEEWLRFTQRLSQAGVNPGALNRTILSAVCDIVDSPGGALWHRMPGGNFVVGATLGMYESVDYELAAADALIMDLESSMEPRNLADDAELERERGLAVPDWMLGLSQVALLVPIEHDRKLIAFMLLAKPRSGETPGWEDMDMLATVARQAASYLALLRATDALSEARQFETFNRLSAFLVHDLKNVVAQLSLIDSNARRHGTNPEFVQDAFTTVRDAVAKMNRMLASLTQTQPDLGSTEVVDVCEVAREAIQRKSDASPRPVYSGAESGIAVRAGRDRLLSVIEHLLQNAIEATDASGAVEIHADADGTSAYLEIRDDGCGMDRDFINYRLFRPFDTTKGKAGMGIGAYESRHIIDAMNGELLVESEPGRGTTFRIVLPLTASDDAERSARPATATAGEG